jgi:hypothetical protein
MNRAPANCQVIETALDRWGAAGRRAGARLLHSISGEEFAEYVVDGLGIGLAFGGAHDLADEKFEHAFVAGFEFGNVVGVFGDYVARGLLDLGRV